jgi:outer membrane protein assembly factor BamB/predicted MPP superfamily phosphohydrolase
VPAGEVVDARDHKPLGGVVVSDGLMVTRTSADGGFAIPDRDDAEFVFVTVPSSHRALEPGWFAPVRDRGTSPLRFELARRDEPSAVGCRFVQITDLHVSVDNGARLRPMLTAGVVSPPGIDVMGEIDAADLRADLGTILARTRPDFVVATGDLSDYGQRAELEAYRDVVAELDVPVASVPGNHDQLSCLTPEAIEAFFRDWPGREDKGGRSASEAFQREVFGGDWRRPGSGRAPWLAVMGPLYYSFDWGGVHFVVYDGEGLRRYGDEYPQDRWLVADLATTAPSTPVVVLTHFPEDRAFYRSRFGGVRLLASVSGHWHGTRVWHDGGTHHWTSSTLGFGGIDFTPRGFRVVDMDDRGARSRWETMEAPSPGPRVTGAAIVAGGAVVTASEQPDGSGSVRAVDGWARDLPVAARGGLAVDRDTVYLLDLGGELVALDTRTGGVRWRRQLGDPSARWSLGAPAVADGRVYAGSANGVDALDARNGERLWHTALASSDWAASWSGVAVGGDVVVIGAANDELHLAALDAATGDVRWRHEGRDIAGVTATPVVEHGLVLAVRAPGWLTAHALVDGARVWETALDDAWPVALAVTDDRALVRSSTGSVGAHALDGGVLLWRRALDTGPRAGRPYSRAPGGMRLPLVVIDRSVWTGELDALVELDLATGEFVRRIDVGAEVATVVADGSDPLAVTIDGEVVRSSSR